MKEPPEFDARALFVALAQHAVDYVTIGGIAVQAHGGQRVTQDLDVAIRPGAANAERLAAALAQLDARVLGPEGRRSTTSPAVALLRSSEQRHLISDHGALDVNVLPAALGSFEEIRARAHDVPLGDISVPIASRQDLLATKRAAGRPQDLDDIELLESIDDE